MKVRYTTVGSVRGTCGHNHLTVEAAARCGAKDDRGCAVAGGYSDREVVKLVDGEREEMTEEEYQAVSDVRWHDLRWVGNN